MRNVQCPSGRTKTVSPRRSRLLLVRAPPGAGLELLLIIITIVLHHWTILFDSTYSSTLPLYVAPPHLTRPGAKGKKGNSGRTTRKEMR